VRFQGHPGPPFHKENKKESAGTPALLAGVCSGGRMTRWRRMFVDGSLRVGQGAANPLGLRSPSVTEFPPAAS
jgi:hypothetical protein